MTIIQFDEALAHHGDASFDAIDTRAPSDLARIGERMGFYREFELLGSLTVDELARLSRADQRYVHDWLAIQAASGRLAYSPRTQRYSLPPAAHESSTAALAQQAGLVRRRS